MKKFIVVMVLSMLFSGQVFAQTTNTSSIDALQSQINELLKTLKGLQAQIPTNTSTDIGDTDTQSDNTCVVLTQNIRRRSRDTQTNGEVSQLQDFLQSNGFLNSEPTGYVGLVTVKAIKSFQSSNDISPSGFVGPITRSKIQTLSCGGSSLSNPNPVTEPTRPQTPATQVPSPVSPTPQTTPITPATPQAPTISYITPQSATAGTNIFVYGSNFNRNTFLFLNGDFGPAITTTYISPTSLSFVVPSGLNTGSHSLYVNEIASSFPRSSPILLTIVPTPIVRIPVAPALTYMGPSSAPAGEIVYVYGSNFNRNTFLFLNGDFGPAITTTYISPTSLSFVVPLNTSIGSYKLQVNEIASNFQPSNPLYLTVVATPQAPTISYITPQSATAGTNIFVYGSNFNRNTFLFLNGDFGPAITTTYISPTSLSFVVPSGLNTGSHSLYVNEIASSFPRSSPVFLNISGRL